MSPTHWRWLALILVAAALLRVPAVIADPVVSVDESRYLRLAETALDHPGVLLLHKYHPAYPATLVPIAALLPEAPERAARLLSLLLGLLAVGCCFGLARERFGPEAGLFAAALFALHPGPVEASGHILSEAVYVPAVLGSCWALLRMLRGGGLWAAAVFGACAGLAYLTRPEGLAAGAVGLGWLAVGGAVRRGEEPAPVRRRLALIGVAGLALALTAGPYMASIGGLTRKKATGLGALDAKDARKGPDEAISRITASWVGPADVPSSERSRGAEFLHEWFSGPTPVLWLVALAAVIWALRRRRRPASADVVLAGVIGLYLAAHVFLLMRAGYLSSRHVWPVAALALPWLGQALWLALQWRPAGKEWAGRAVVGVTVAAAMAFGVTAAAWPWRSNRSYLREAGLALRDRCSEETGVLATDPRVAYYAGARTLIIGRIGWLELLRVGSERGARFIACEDADLARRVEGFDPENPRGAELLQALELPARRGRPAGRFLIYEISKKK